MIVLPRQPIMNLSFRPYCPLPLNTHQIKLITNINFLNDTTHATKILAGTFKSSQSGLCGLPSSHHQGKMNCGIRIIITRLLCNSLPTTLCRRKLRKNFVLVKSCLKIRICEVRIEKKENDTPHQKEKKYFLHTLKYSLKTERENEGEGRKETGGDNKTESWTGRDKRQRKKKEKSAHNVLVSVLRLVTRYLFF